MYAMAFDMMVDALKKHYGEPYNNAYNEIEQTVKDFGFIRKQDSLYLNESGAANPLRSVYSAIDALKKIDWFCKSVRDLRVFKVEDWSDFTEEFDKLR